MIISLVMKYNTANYGSSWGPPWEDYTRFRKHSILERTDTYDSIIYLIDEFIFYEDSSLIENNLITKKYYRNTALVQIPFELFDGSYRELYLTDYCEFNLWSYTVTPDHYLSYCEIDDVWGHYDQSGPSDVETTTFIFGLGMYYYRHTSYNGGIQWSSTYKKEIIYFQKNGISCGNEIIVNINDPIELNNKIHLFPNPAKQILNINLLSNAKYKSLNFEIWNLQGQIIKEKIVLKPENNTININGLPPGLYLYIIKDEDLIIQQGKLIVQ